MFRKELSYYFSTPIAYIVIGLFLLAVSLFLWVIPGQWNVIESGYAQVDGLFQISPWLLMLVCPALTMRLFAEERQTGTWLLLRAQPIALWKIVVGKYMAAFVLTVLALLPCIVHYFIVFYMAEPIGNIDGKTQAPTTAWKEMNIKILPVTAGLTTFLPVPPNSILTTIMAKTLPKTGAYKG